MPKKKQQQLTSVAIDKCVLLKRNPQFLTRKQMESLKKSIKKDGFVVPILVRPHGRFYEVVSGNHRFMAAVELGFKKVPAVVAKLTEHQTKRLAINLNTIHGEPSVESLAPFLAEMPNNLLKEIHIEDDLMDQLEKFDEELADTLKKLSVPTDITRNKAVTSPIKTCVCPRCKTKHIVTAKNDSD